MRNKWYHKATEQVHAGYSFSGNIYVTKRIKEELESNEIQQILNHIWGRIDDQGIDYIQIYYDKTGRTVFVIDNLNNKIKIEKDTKWVKENDYLTVMFADEY